MPTVDFATSLASIAENGGAQNVNPHLQPSHHGSRHHYARLDQWRGCELRNGLHHHARCGGHHHHVQHASRATTASFPVTALNDIFAEATETVTFVISGTTGGINLAR
ncbi:MAG: hypothetical protein IPK99_05110 [Flavobacteriales bacterium]|nr:hypothetical protein [Flavobacteriales bacterium]